MFAKQNFDGGSYFPFSESRMKLDSAALPASAATGPDHPTARIVDSPMPRGKPFRAGRIPPRAIDLRILAADAFFWGKRPTPPRPLTRPEHVVIWLTHGRMLLQFPGQDLHLNAGDVQHIPAGTAFATMPYDNCRGHVLVIGRTLAEQALPALPERGLAARLGHFQAQLAATVGDLARAVQDPASGARRTLISTLSAMLRQMPPRGPARGDHGGGARPDAPLVARMTELLQRRQSEQWTIAELAAELQCSTAMLDQVCLATRGCRAIDLANRIRLETAFEALRSTTESPAHIAARLGYSSHAHLARACVAATGRSPEAFRAQSGWSASSWS